VGKDSENIRMTAKMGNEERVSPQMFFPPVMMPLRIVQACRDEVKLGLDRGEDTDNPLFTCMIYALLIVGIVFSLYQLCFVCHLLAISVGSACLCLLAVLFPLCDIIAAVCIWAGKCWRLKSRDSQMEA